MASIYVKFLLFEIEAWTSALNPMTFSNTTLLQLLNDGGYAIISAGRNPALSTKELALTDELVQARLGNLSTDLTNIYLYSDVLGMYDGASEASFLVVLHNESPEQERAAICQLGEKYHQDSIIYVRQASPAVQQLIYTTGPFSGSYVEGQGYEILSTNVTDNYSSIRLCPNGALTFTLNFDFEQMITHQKSRSRTTQLLEHHARNRVLNHWQRLTRS